MIAETLNAVPQAVSYADVQLDRLVNLLDEEFNALKEQDLDAFEELLNEKNQILADLTQLTGVRQPEDADRLGSEWTPFRNRMMTCRDMHRRNEILILRKLDAIRGALESLNVNDPTSPVEVYDRLGQVARFSRGRGYQDA